MKSTKTLQSRRGFRLAQCLVRGLPTRNLWHVPAFGFVTCSDVLGVFGRHRAHEGTLSGKKVAIWLSDSFRLSTLLVFLDGLCESLILIPEGSTAGQADGLLKAGQADYLFHGDRDSVSCKEISTGEELFEFDFAGFGEHRSTSLSVEREAETRWIIPTSGTSGAPRLVAHSLTTLTRTSRTSEARGHEFCWGLLYSLSRFAGLQVFFQALLGHSTLVLVNPSDPLDHNISCLAESGCNALSATPTMWRRILMSPAGDKLALRQITLGGEIADQKLLDVLGKTFPAARIVHVFASTEAGVGFSVADGQAGFPAAYIKNPPGDVEISVDSEGCLCLRPQVAGQNYNRGGETIFDKNGWVRTGDLVRNVGNRFVFLGRDSGCINVGGNKVHPEEVEQVLMEFSKVADAHVKGIKNPIMGFLVAADIVPTLEVEDKQELEKELLQLCRSRLEPYKVPVLIRFVEETAVSETGKVRRTLG